MKIYYAKSTNGFYNTSINGDDIPSDAVEITDDLRESLLLDQSNGKIISSDENGNPISIDQISSSTLSTEKLALYAFAKRDSLLDAATRRIGPLQDAIDFNIATDNEKSELLEWKEYRVDLNRIENQDGFPSDIQWPTEPSN